MLAIIGGSGLAQLENLEITHRQVIRTPFGEPSGAVTFGEIGGHPVMFLARHGHAHSIAPHNVNYRANLWALHSQGATHVLSVASVGGIRPDLTPGSLVIPDQIIDYTWGRKHTFHEPDSYHVVHTDFTEPYAPSMRALCLEAAQALQEPVIDGGVYAATQGPRLDTRAEVDRMERDGADMCGMTGMPEAALARELDLQYAAIAAVVNFAAGRGNSLHAIDPEEIQRIHQASMARVRAIVAKVVLLYHD